jgi:hypothetical protein
VKNEEKITIPAFIFVILFQFTFLMVSAVLVLPLIPPSLNNIYVEIFTLGLLISLGIWWFYVGINISTRIFSRKTKRPTRNS